MEERKDNGCIAAWILCELVAAAIWAILIILKAAGVVHMSWFTVLSGLVWISWILFLLELVLAVLVWQIVKFKRWHRRYKVDRRIIMQAKAIGAWDKKPTPLGGRALELKAWKEYKIKRAPGETDKQLRCRYMAKADAVPQEGGGNHGL